MDVIEIISTGRALPKRRVSNDDLAAELLENYGLETSDEWIRSHTGISSRRLASDDETCGDLAFEAGLNALTAALGGVISAESLDVIVVATAMPDYFSFPATACLVQERLEAKNACAFDLAAGCTGFIYALETAAGLLRSGEARKRALVIGAETLSRIVDWSDRGSCVLFGDGAGAVVLEKRPAASGERAGILRTVLGADGGGRDALIIRQGGSRHPYKTGEIIGKAPHIEMNGHAVYNFAVKAVTDTIERLLAEEGLQLDDVRWFVPHQANGRIVSAAAKRLKLDESRFFMNVSEYANTGAASVPIALDELARGGGLSRGDLVLCVGFGAGLTYGGSLIVW